MKTEESRTGELPCLVVYSDRRHVNYVNIFINGINQVLRNRGFRAELLSGEARSGDDYLMKLLALIDDSVLGIVILDGFRPNVIFELGLLIGRKKPVIILRSNNAFINVRTLYRLDGNSSIKHVTGLTKEEFARLENPHLDISNHFSDYGGKHIPYVDVDALETDSNHISKILEQELADRMNEIVEETKKVQTKGIELPADVLLLLTKIVSSYFDKDQFGAEQVIAFFERAVTLSKAKGIVLPPAIHSIVAETILVRAGISKELPKKTRYIQKAIAIYHDLIALPGIPVEEVAMWKKSYANAHMVLGDVMHSIEAFHQAEKFFLEAREVLTAESYPEDYGDISYWLLIIYNDLAEMEDVTYAKKSDAVAEEATKIFRIEENLLMYARVRCRQSTALTWTANNENNPSLIRKALDNLNSISQEELKKISPPALEIVCREIAGCHSLLGALEQDKVLLQKGIDEYERVSKTASKEHNLLDYAVGIVNYAMAWERAAKAEESSEKYHFALDKYREAFGILKQDTYPYEYARLNIEVATVYLALSLYEEPDKNLQSATYSLEQAAKYFTKHNAPRQNNHMVRIRKEIDAVRTNAKGDNNRSDKLV